MGLTRTMGTVGTAAITLGLAGLTGRADPFDGTFTSPGPYAQGGWSQTSTNNAAVDSPSHIDTWSEFNLAIVGATATSAAPLDPPSILDLEHTIAGVGPQTISFSYLYSAEDLSHPSDSASFLVDGLVSADLSANPGTTLIFTTTLNPGQSFGFRLSSDNDNVANNLQIFAVPEPGTLALASLGGVALLALGLFRRR